ncbi:MAG TPA: RNA methyltransferase [Bryobacteraceae bacterium]|nr:RNA methyltransferase [Bryobacteraceae bacterium]
MDQFRVVLVTPRNPLNIGAAARAMSNFGFFHLRVVNPYQVAYDEARSAVKAAEVLAASKQYSTVADAVADCPLVVGTSSVGPRTLTLPLRRLETAGRLLRDAPGPVALLFGSEKFGLSNDDMTHCHWLLRIPTREEHGSMNLGQAVAVCLYELIRSEREAERVPEEARPASAGDIERLYARLVETLVEAGYLKGNTVESGERKVRQMLHRLSLTERDVVLWLGMLRQILWKVRHEDPTVK